MTQDLAKAAEPASDLSRICAEIRGELVRMSNRGKTPHLASSLSCVDAVVAAYWAVLAVDPLRPDDPDRDRFVLSKGHAATTLYAALAHRGYFPTEYLETEYNVDGGKLAEHPGPRCVPGVEAATGSLGHGLPIGIGMALAGRIQGRTYRVYALMSDGECNEGSVWEAAMFAPKRGLDNICVVIDYNKWQATDRSNDVMALQPLREKWEAFGWSAHEIDGHDLDALIELMRDVPDGSGSPVAIVANTVKGKGVSFMEDDNNWHYRVPTDEEVQQALRELGLA